MRVSFVPVTRDAHNNVMMVDPSAGDGAKLRDVVKRFSHGAPLKALRINGQEVVLLDTHLRAP